MAHPSPPPHELVRDAVREARGRRPVRPATTIEAAEAEVRDYLVAPEWHEGGPSADVAADVLRAAPRGRGAPRPVPLGALRRGRPAARFGGPVPVPVLRSGGKAPGGES